MYLDQCHPRNASHIVVGESCVLILHGQVFLCGGAAGWYSAPVMHSNFLIIFCLY